MTPESLYLVKAALLRVAVWKGRALQAGQQGPEEGPQNRDQPVGRGQAARRGEVDEGRSPLAVIERAVISKITQIPEEGRHFGFWFFVCVFFCVPERITGPLAYLPASLE